MIMREFNLGFYPEFGLTCIGVDMNMHPGLLSRKEIEAKTALPEYRRTHSIPPVQSRLLKSYAFDKAA